jgi:hypothetical protein
MRQDQDLKCLDGLIADLGGSRDARTRSADSCDLLLEHLQAARRDLLGSQRGEYRSSLQFADEASSCITDKSVRAETRKTLRSLLSPIPAPFAPAV